MQNLSGSTALHYLVQLPLSDHLLLILDMMIRKEVGIESANEFGITPLHKACGGQSDGVVIFLLASGADANACTSHKECAIHIACRLGKRRLVEALIAHGAKVDIIGPDGNAEETARRNGHDALVSYIHNLKQQDGSKKRRKKKHEDKTSEKHASLRASANGRDRRATAIAPNRQESTSPTMVKSPTTPSIHSSSDDVVVGMMKSSSHKKAMSSSYTTTTESEDELAASSLTPKSSARHTITTTQKQAPNSPTRLEPPQSPTHEGAPDSPAESRSHALSAPEVALKELPRNQQRLTSASTSASTCPVTPLSLQLPSITASNISLGSSSTNSASASGGLKSPTSAPNRYGGTADDSHRSIVSGEEDDFSVTSGGSVRSTSARMRSAKINSLMKIFQPLGAETITPGTTLDQKRTSVSRGSSPIATRHFGAKDPKRSSDPARVKGSASTASIQSTGSSDAPQMSSGAASLHSSPRASVNSEASFSPRVAPIINGLASPHSHSPRSSSPLVRAPLSPPRHALVRSTDSDDSSTSHTMPGTLSTSSISTDKNSRSASPLNGERKTSPVPTLKLSSTPPSGSQRGGSRSISPNSKHLESKKRAPPLSAHPATSSHYRATLESHAPASMDIPYSLSSRIPSVLGPVTPDLSSEEETMGDSVSPRSLVSSRSFSTDLLMSDSASDTNSDSKIPSGRRFGEPPSPRTIRQTSSKPVLDRSTSDILGKVKVKGAENSLITSSVAGTGSGRGQPQLHGIHRLSSTEFGPRTVQRVSKNQNKSGSRLSRPFSKFLKDVNFDTMIAVQDYLTHFQGVVSVDEAMIIPSPEFVIEYGRSSSGSTSPISTPTTVSASQQRYPMFSEDTEPVTWNYKLHFFDENMLSKAHWNFVSYVELKFHASAVPMIFSLVPKGAHSIMGLARTPAGDVTFNLDIGDRKVSSLTAKKLVRLMQEQNEALKNAKIYAVKDGSLADQLLEYEKAEKNQFRPICTHKVGVVYVKEGQITEEEVLGNKNGSPGFEAFLDCIGTKIDLFNWNGFDGGLDTKKDRTGKRSVFATWRDFEIMFHVSTYLPLGSGEEKFVERKKHIANDMTTIIYLDTKSTSFKPPTLSGDFLNNFIVVHPKPDGQLGVSISTKKGTPEFGPQLPVSGLFTLGDHLREFLLCKIINAERAALLAPMFLTKRRQARQHWLAGMINKYIPSK